MSYINSPFHPGQSNDDYELDGENMDDYPADHNFNDHSNNHDYSDEDTDEASEVEYNNYSQQKSYERPIEIKEQMYLDKLTNLKKQLEELENRTHPEYIRRVKKLDYQREERKRLNEIYKDYLIDCANRDYIYEKTAAVKEYEEKKADLKENLISDCDDKRKIIEAERNNMELNADSMEVKSTVTRKLRRRPNEPVPVAAEKRRKAPSGQLILQLDDKEIENDLKLINRGKMLLPPPSSSSMQSIRTPNIITNGLSGALGSPTIDSYQLVETKIEDNKLLYERRWFHRGQSVFIESKDLGKFAATISAIANDNICVKKLNDSKVKISILQLAHGRVIIRRRAT